MKTIHVALIVALLMLPLAACELINPEQEDHYDGATFILETHGGIAQTRQVLTVEPTKLVYVSYSQGGAEIARSEKKLDQPTYEDVVSDFRKSDFLNLDPNYTTPPGSPQVMDAGTEILGMVNGDIAKNVTISPYVPAAMPPNVAAVDASLREMVALANNKVVVLQT